MLKFKRNCPKQVGVFSLTAAPHAGDDCTDASPNEDEAQ